MTLADALRDYVDGFARLGHPALVERFILRNGGAVQQAAKLPKRYAYGPKRQCFMNATQLVLRAPTLEYVEGFVMLPALPLPIHHAWTVSPAGSAYDNTLPDTTGCQYLGVTFSREELRAAMRASGVYGLLDTGRGVNARLIFARDPELEGIVAAFRPVRAEP